MDQVPFTKNEKLWAEYMYAKLFETPEEEANYLRQMLKLDDQDAFVPYFLGGVYSTLGQYDNPKLKSWWFLQR